MRTITRHAAVGAIAVVAIVAAVLVGDTPPDDGGNSSPPVVAAGDDIAELRAFDGCDQLTTHVRRTLERSGFSPDGVPQLAVMPDVAFARDGTSAEMNLDAVGAAEGTARAPAPRTADDGVSSTNVQEVGIDEPDIVETDGRILLATTTSALRVVDLTGESPRLAASVALDEGQHQVFLLEERALVMSQTWHHPVPEPLMERGEGSLLPLRISPARTELTLLDLSDPDAPSELATATVDGDLVSARATEGTVRLVLRSWPDGIDLRMPADPAAADEAERHNDAVLSTIRADQVLPRMTVRDDRGGTLRDAPAVDCTAVSRPASPAGVGNTTILTLRPEDGDLLPEDSTSVMADSQVVYASADRLYVATSRWEAAGPADDAPFTQPPATTTEFHAFDTTAPTTTRHVASGAVEGRLLNQWALSEREGVLRVAVTRDGRAGPSPEGAAEGPRSDSAIVTLTERAGDLVRLGEVGGLGPGEQIFAVRFFDDLATVVTFRQIDPLYTVDLSDPASPRVLGELKIPGFSNYLHPVGDGWLLGIGQDADEQGQQLGVQVSLFDIRDLATPRRSANLVLGQGHSEVQHDHHAFLWWPDQRLAVVPLEMWEVQPVDGDAPDARRATPWTGAVLVRVDTDTASLEELTRITHPGDQHHPPGIRRAVVADGRLLTVSEAGVQSNDLETVEPAGWVAF